MESVENKRERVAGTTGLEPAQGTGNKRQLRITV
jgi:hypothetical protein